MRRSLVLAAAFVFGLALPLLMAQVSGFPSRPRFQTALVGIGAAPTQSGDLTARADVNGVLSATIDNDSNGTANQARVIVSSGDALVQLGSGGSGRITPLITNGATGAVGVVKTFGAIPLEFATANTLAATISAAQVMDFVNVPTVAAAAIYESGTFVVTFETACTTSPTMTVDWARAGNVVTLDAVAKTGFPCTGDSTSFTTTGTPVPAAIRPAANVVTAVYSAFTNNSAGTWGEAVIETSGKFSFSRCATFGAACSLAGWTAALNREGALPRINYLLGNP